MTAALLCGESYYSIGRRFGLSAMSISRHFNRCLMGDVGAWRQRSLAYGPKTIRPQLLAFIPAAAAEIRAWLKGDRPEMPTKEWPEPKLKELRRQRLELSILSNPSGGA